MNKLREEMTEDPIVAGANELLEKAANKNRPFFACYMADDPNDETRGCAAISTNCGTLADNRFVDLLQKLVHMPDEAAESILNRINFLMPMLESIAAEEYMKSQSDKDIHDASETTQ